MYKEAFLTLAEINSLQHQLAQILCRIKEEQKREELFKDKIDQLQTDIIQLKEKLQLTHQQKIDTEKNYQEIENRIQKAEEHLSRATSEAQMHAAQNELSKLNQHFTQLENELLTLLEQEEEISEEFSNKQQELQGLKKSLQEVQQEVCAAITRHQQEEESLQERITALQNQLPHELQTAYKTVSQRHYPAISFVQAGKCSECCIKIPSNVEQQLYTHHSLEMCSNCGRILVVK